MHARNAMTGAGGILEVFTDKPTIIPKGALGFMLKRVKGTKEIPFASIIPIQFKKAGVWSGYLHSTTPEGKESKSRILAATQDENTFMFRDKRRRPTGGRRPPR